MLSVLALIIQSCATLINTGGNSTTVNNTSGNDSLHEDLDLVGSSNTAGTFRYGASQGPTPTEGTPNTTGPSPDPGYMPDGTRIPLKMKKLAPNTDYIQWFIIETALNGKTEEALSQIALSRTKNDSVKNYAATIIKDHTAAETDLKTLAASKNVTLPDVDPAAAAAANSPWRGHNPSSPLNLNEKISKLTHASDDQFDKVYISLITSDAQDAVNFFQQGSKDGDRSVKDYVKKYLPVLKSRLKNVPSMSLK